MVEGEVLADGRPPRDAGMKDKGCLGALALLLLALLLMKWDGDDGTKLDHAIDWMGRICGLDENVTDRPLLYFCVKHGQMASDGICVDSCPTGSATSHVCPGEPKAEESKDPVPRVTVTRPMSKVEDVASANAFDMFCLPEDSLIPLVNPQLLGLEQGVIVALQGVSTHLAYLLVLGFAVGTLSFVTMRFLTAARVMRAIIAVPGAISALLCTFFLLGFFNIGFNLFFPWADKVNAKLTTLMFTVIFGGYAGWHGRWFLKRAPEEVDSAVKAAEPAADSLSNLLQIKDLCLIPWAQAVVNLMVLVFLLRGLLDLAAGATIQSPAFDAHNSVGLDITGVGRSRHFEDWQWRWLVIWTFGGVWTMKTVAGLGQFATAYALAGELGALPDVAPIRSRAFVGAVLRRSGSCAFGGFIACLIGNLVSWLLDKVHMGLAHLRSPIGVELTSWLELVMRISSGAPYVACVVQPGRSLWAAARQLQAAPLFQEELDKAKLALSVLSNVKRSLAMMGALVVYFNLERPPVQSIAPLVLFNVSGIVIAAGAICYSFGSAFLTHFEMLIVTNTYVKLGREPQFQALLQAEV